MGLKQIKQFDLFSLPFQFSILNNDKKKQTYLGGLVSVIILSLSISYFVYLCYLYFGNRLNPSISLTNEFYNHNFEMTLQNNFLNFKIVLPSGKSLSQLESETGLVYLNIIAQYVEKDENGKTQNKQISFIQCEDDNLKDYYCLDFSQINNKKDEMTLKYDKDDLDKYKLQILFIQCNPFLIAQGQQCASALQIRTEVVRLSTLMLMRLNTQQYNPSLQNYEQKVKQEVFTLTDGLSFISKIVLQKSTTIISEGFILSTEAERTYFSDYKRVDTVSTVQFMQQELLLELIGYIYFYIGESGQKQQIQFPQFTSLLAQFSSIFNSLLAVGFICRIFAQSELVQDFEEVQIKSYYKKTALSLISQINKQKKKIISVNTESIPNQLSSLYYQIKNMDYRYYIQNYLNVSLFQKIKLFILSGFSIATSKKDSNQIKIYKELVKQTQKQMNILEIQRELMQIKIMLRMILSVEQYAAIQLCGYSVISKPAALHKESDQQLLQQSPNEIQQELIKQESLHNVGGNKNKIDLVNQFQLIKGEQQENLILNEMNNCITNNHLERIDQIETDQNYFELCLQKFLEKNHKSEIDERILECMIGINQQKEMIEQNSNKD